MAGRACAKGYTSMECRGKGGHVLLDDILSGGVSRVRIEAIVQPACADKIVDHLELHRHMPLTVCVENVDVPHPEKF